MKDAEYIGSYINETQCPKDDKPEYAFIGRSNVGKSSLINMLCDRKDLARTSNTPGKTQTINYYLINKSWYIVDLPGYGYARVSKTMREDWKSMIRQFLVERTQIKCVFVLIDSMIDPQKIDMEFMNDLGEENIPFVVAYTKTDRLNKSEVQGHIETIQREILKSWNLLPEQFITSAEKGTGKAEILQFIENINQSAEIDH